MNSDDKYKQEETQQGLEPANISKIFKGISAIAFLLFMLFLVINKLGSIKQINTSGWLALAVIFISVTLMSVKLSDILDKNNNMSENTNMNISLVIVFLLAGGSIYLFWDVLSPIF